jgi:hypothetical protein
MSEKGQSLQVLCHRARCEVRFDPKTDLIPMPNPMAACLLRRLHVRRPCYFSSDRMSFHSPWCSSSAAAYQRLLNSSSTAQPTFLPRDLSLSRRLR